MFYSFCLSLVCAMQAFAVENTETQHNQWYNLVLPIAMIGILYFLIVRPHQKRLKEQKDMVSALAKGDTVSTSAGIIGKIDSVQDTVVTLEISPAVFVNVFKTTINMRLNDSALLCIQKPSDKTPPEKKTKTFKKKETDDQETESS